MIFNKALTGLIPRKSDREERTFFSTLLRSIDDLGSKLTKETQKVSVDVYKSLAETGVPLNQDGTINAEFPQTPEGLTANGAFNSVILQWVAPTYGGHDYTEIFRATTDDLSVALDNGVWLRSYPNIKADAVDAGTTHYYWIRFVNKLGQAGAFNSPLGTAGVTSVPVDQMLDEMAGRITLSELESDLAEPIASIGGIADYVGSIDSDKSDYELMTAEAIIGNALSVSADKEEIRQSRAVILEEKEARATETEALASQITTIQVELGDDIASVQQSAEATASSVDGLMVKYGVKLDVNGYVTGFAMNNDGETGTFLIRADQFGVIDPVSTTDQSAMTTEELAASIPFFVSGGNTYIKSAYIKDLSADNFIAGKIVADEVNVTELSSVSSDLGSVTAGVMQSSDGRFLINLTESYMLIKDDAGNQRVFIGRF